ncbi:hypothetical protein D8B26_005553 [Coccidioides posadasii str. Silveira]|uniref:Uncharacterized protein n=2 Tax=Coccidioides posadasii TaxID=199306 RepID=E9D3U3_COCPS|nr:conserved hypothetical protein [Coccidioides posadasii str. Silveira]QVM10902.1 hypothetical protein D8B26_005553 [Coccidioides posadasii str. Silveira]
MHEMQPARLSEKELAWRWHGGWSLEKPELPMALRCSLFKYGGKCNDPEKGASRSIDSAESTHFLHILTGRCEVYPPTILLDFDLMIYSRITSETTKPLGVPTRRWYCEKAHFLALLGCYICFILSILAIQPSIGPAWSLSWKLGLTNQLVVIGLLLSLMNECTSVLAATLFLIVETRRKNPTLQNYEAIIKKSIFLDKMDMRWRTSFLLLTLLPLGLSVAYKRLIGGSSTIEAQTEFPRYYGLVPLPLGTFNVMNNSIYYMINSSVPYIAASFSARSGPKFPEAYGFNTVLLDSTSTAFLDLPSPDFLSSVQQNLTEGGSWSISASVDGTVARYNASTSSYRDDDGFWTTAFNHSANPGGLSTISLYNGFQIGLINGLHSEYPGPYCLLGFFRGDSYGLNIYGSPDEDISRAFRRDAHKFEIQRERCQGRWTVTPSSIQLVDGSCTGERTKQDVFNNSTPYYADVLPILAQWLIRYSPAESQSNSPWLIPSFTTSVASMFWARMIYMNPTNDLYPEMYYPPADETLWSTKLGLKAGWTLYLTLSIHPILCTLILISICVCYKTPIGTGFGLVSVLSSVRKDSLDQLQGAGLSGTLTRTVPMRITIQDSHHGPKIRCCLGDEYEGKAELDIKETYF